MEGWSNSLKRKSEMQETCSTCYRLQQHNEWLYSKCQIYEKHIESLAKINAESGISMQESQQKIEKLNQVVALLKQQIAEKIAEISMLRVESDANKGGKVEENNLPDTDKFLEVKMEIPNSDNSREKETSNERDVEIYSEMENSENSDDINQETEESSKTTRSKTMIPCLEPGCPKVFSTNWYMTVHYKVRHTGERKGFTCPLEDCGRVFEYKHVLTKHMTTHRPYQCRFPRCYQSFASKQSLDEHSETHGPVEGGHECTFDGCGMKFPNARGVREHVKATHTGETPYVCPYECGKAFASERGLKKHVNVHTRMAVPDHSDRVVW